MKKNLLLALLSPLVFCCCSKMAGYPIIKAFSVESSYTELEVEDAFDVTVSDTATQIIVMAGENVMPKVVVKRDGNTLKIYLKGWNSNYGTDMKIILPYNVDLKEVELSGASEFHSDFGLRGQKVTLDLSGASEFYCDIEAEEISIDLSGASDFHGQVTATDLDIDLSGASDAEMEGRVSMLKLDLSGASSIAKKLVEGHYALVCDKCEGSLSGSSDAAIHCDGWITVSLSGSSNLYYTGDARTSGSTTSGGSNISHDRPSTRP